MQTPRRPGADFFTNEEVDRNTILGEAYAIRGMMHFDLLRLFGASLEVDADGRYIPYVETYPSTVNPPISNRDFMAKVIDDLEKARDLLKTLDVEVNPSYATSTAYRFFASTNPPQGKFYNNRGTRLNYYAVTVLLARRLPLGPGDRRRADLCPGDYRPGDRRNIQDG